MEKLQRRVEVEMMNMIEQLDKTYLRKMQGRMYRCAAQCCDDETCSTEELNDCIENCSKPLTKSHNYVKEECERVKNRLQRCVMDCEDTMKDKAGPNLSVDNMENYMKELKTCTTKCVDNYSEMLPHLEKKLKDTFSKEKLK